MKKFIVRSNQRQWGGGGGGGNGATSAFDPAKKGSGTTLSGSNRTATIDVDSVSSQAMTLSGKSAGKWYSEFLLVSNSLIGTICQIAVGVTDGTNFAVNIGNTLASWSFMSTQNGITLFSFKRHNNVGSAYGTHYLPGDTVGMALDFGTGNLFFSRNNVWQGSGDPVTQANPTFSGVAGTLFAGVSLGSPIDESIIVCQAPAIQVYAPPAGYTAWN